MTVASVMAAASLLRVANVIQNLEWVCGCVFLCGCVQEREREVKRIRERESAIDIETERKCEAHGYARKREGACDGVRQSVNLEECQC